MLGSCGLGAQLLLTRLTDAKEIPGTAAMLAHLREHALPCCVNSATPALIRLGQQIDGCGARTGFGRLAQ